MSGSWRDLTRGNIDFLRLDDPVVGILAGTNDGGIEYSVSAAALQTAPGQGDKFQAALDAAGTDIGPPYNRLPNRILISGLFATDNPQHALPTDKEVSIIGTGMGSGIDSSPAGILFRSDDGEEGEFYGLKTNKNFPVFLEGFTMAGPGWGGGTPLGDLPGMMGGLYLDGAAILRDLRIYGFAYGIGTIGDHHYGANLNLQGNGVNLNYLHNPEGGLGDETWLKCQFSNATRASVGIADTNTIANARFGDNGHNGAAPYSFWRYASPVGDVVSCSGTNGSVTVTSVALSSRAPGGGARVTGTNIPIGTKI